MNLTHLLDTSWLIRHFRGETAYTRTMQHLGAEHLAITDVATLPIDRDICRLFGEHRARLRQANQLIGDVDLFIAVTCLQHNLTLLTTNRTHFQRVPGLQIRDTPLP